MANTPDLAGQVGQLNTQVQAVSSTVQSELSAKTVTHPGTSIPTQSSTQTSGAVYFSTPFVVASAVPTPNNTALAWSTVLASASGVKTSAKEVILEIYGLTDSTNTASGGMPQVQVRANSSSPVYTALFLISSASGYGSAMGSIFRTSCANGNFDWQTTLPGLNNQFRMRVLGYVL